MDDWDSAFKDISLEVNTADDGHVVTITLVADEPITNEDMVKALDQFIEELIDEPGVTIQ